MIALKGFKAAVAAPGPSAGSGGDGRPEVLQHPGVMEGDGRGTSSQPAAARGNIASRVSGLDNPTQSNYSAQINFA